MQKNLRIHKTATDCTSLIKWLECVASSVSIFKYCPQLCGLEGGCSLNNTYDGKLEDTCLLVNLVDRIRRG